MFKYRKERVRLCFWRAPSLTLGSKQCQTSITWGRLVVWYFLCVWHSQGYDHMHSCHVLLWLGWNQYNICLVVHHIFVFCGVSSLQSRSMFLLCSRSEILCALAFLEAGGAYNSPGAQELWRYTSTHDTFWLQQVVKGTILSHMWTTLLLGLHFHSYRYLSSTSNCCWFKFPVVVGHTERGREMVHLENADVGGDVQNGGSDFIGSWMKIALPAKDHTLELLHNHPLEEQCSYCERVCFFFSLDWSKCQS